MPARPRWLTRRTTVLGSILLILLLVAGTLVAVLSRGSSSPSAASHTGTSHKMVESAMGFGGVPGSKAALQAHSLGRFALHSRLHWMHHAPPLSTTAVNSLLSRINDNDGQGPVGSATHYTHTNIPGLKARIVFGHSHSSHAKSSLAAGPAVTDLNLVDDSAINEDTSQKATSTLEPSVARAGDTIILTGNWFAARSQDGGQNWEGLDPYSLFGQDFCCDQVVLYVPQVNRFFWLAQYSQGKDGGDHLQLDVSSPGDAFDNPCTYSIDPSWFNLPGNTFMDYEDMGATDNYLYLTTNFFPADNSPTQAGVLRLPLADLASCSQPINGEFAVDPNAYHLRPVQNAGSTMILAADNVHGVSSFHYGSTVRFLSWGDSSDSYDTNDVSVDPINLESSNGGSNGGHCGSEDGAVTNWCQRTTGEITSATIANGQIIMAEQAASMGNQRPFPYSRLMYFDASSLKYQGSADLYDPNFAIQYLTLATNAQGDVGGIFSWGGGTGQDHYYPGIGLLVLSADGKHDALDFNDPGEGNACAYRVDHKLRWGDYLSIRPVPLSRDQFEAVGFDAQGGDCGNGGNMYPHVIQFGPSS